MLDRHCADLGRDPREIRRAVITRMSLGATGGEVLPGGEPTMSVGRAVDKLGTLAQVGTDTAILGMGNDTDPDAYHLVAEVVRQVRDL